MRIIGFGITRLHQNFHVRCIPRYLNTFNYQSSLFSSYIPSVIISKASAQFSHCTFGHLYNLQPNLSQRKLIDNITLNAFHQHKRGYAMRLELTEYGISWRRPEAIPSWRPEKSGDLAPFEEPDKTKPILAFQSVQKELSKVDDRVQRLLSMEFSSDKEVVKVANYKLKRQIQQHQFDDDSLEVKIASMTVRIRYLQKIVPLGKTRKQILRKRVRLEEMVATRKKLIKILRRLDYKRFEWLIEELDIIYKPNPRVWDKISRRDSLRKLVDLHCEHLKNVKLDNYRLHLETLKKPFLEEKRETMKWIAETEWKLGLPVSVEVPQEDKQKSELLQLESSTSQSSGDESGS